MVVLHHYTIQRKAPSFHTNIVIIFAKSIILQDVFVVGADVCSSIWGVSHTGHIIIPNYSSVFIHVPIILHHIPARISEPQRIVEAVAVSIICLRVLFVLDYHVGRKHAAKDGVIKPSVHIDEVELVIVLMQGVATVKSRGYVVVAKANGVAPPPPSVVAQPLHGVAVDSGRQVALVVFQGVMHGASSVALCGKDSKQA